MILTINFEMTDRRRRKTIPKVVPRAAAGYGWQLKKMDNSSKTTSSSTDHPSSVAVAPAEAGVTFLFWLHPST